MLMCISALWIYIHPDAMIQFPAQLRAASSESGGSKLLIKRTSELVNYNPISDTLGVKPRNSVNIGDLAIGEIASRPPFDATHRCNYAPVEFNMKLEITFSGSLMRGLSLSLSFSSPESSVIRVIPHHPLSKDLLASFENNDVLSIRNAVSRELLNEKYIKKLS